MRAGVLVVFAKAPLAGAVKTRLAPRFTPEQSADFYAAMLADVLATTAAIAGELHLSAVVAVHPWRQRGPVLRVAPSAFRVVPQRGADLAGRMAWAAREAAAAGAERILLRGSDNPTLDLAAVRAAVAALEAADLALRPDSDGGYGLVGLRHPVPGLFEHAMSTPSVLEDTLARAAAAGLRTAVGDPGFDIDTPADLRRLAAARSAGRARECPRTLAYLDATGLWPD